MIKIVKLINLYFDIMYILAIFEIMNLKNLLDKSVNGYYIRKVL